MRTPYAQASLRRALCRHGRGHAWRPGPRPANPSTAAAARCGARPFAGVARIGAGAGAASRLRSVLRRHELCGDGGATRGRRRAWHRRLGTRCARARERIGASAHGGASPAAWAPSGVGARGRGGSRAGGICRPRCLREGAGVVRRHLRASLAVRGDHPGLQYCPLSPPFPRVPFPPPPLLFGSKERNHQKFSKNLETLLVART
jgi:hypothetical protein